MIKLPNFIVQARTGWAKLEQAKPSEQRMRCNSNFCLHCRSHRMNNARPMMLSTRFIVVVIDFLSNLFS